MVSLSTWAVHGPSAELAALATKLHGVPGVAQVTAFGNTLHVTGEDGTQLEKVVQGLRGDQRLSWVKARPGLEDVFIHLMRGQGQQ